MPDGWRLPEDPHHQPGSHAPDGGDPEFNAERCRTGRTGCGLQGCGRAVWLCPRGGRGLDHPEQLGVDFCHFTPEAHRIFAEKTAELVHQLLD